MDLSLEIQNFEDKNKDDQDSMASSITSILDVSRIELENDETWLYKVPQEPSKSESNTEDWLQDDLSAAEVQSESLNETNNIPKTQSKTQKIIDTRTFTRPKKRYTRPTIGQIYNSDNNSDTNDIMSSSNEMLKKSTDSGVFSNELIHESSEASTPQKPLHFDLTQPSSSFYFDSVLARSGELDSFQNMSPPSLVNSLCSSTFANLMESSFIRNDPVLREIRDTDYTETVLLQDTEPQLYNSITESLSSINSDTPEGFLRRVSHNNSFRRNLERAKEDGNNTFSLIRAQEIELEQCDDSNNETLKTNCSNSEQSEQSQISQESTQNTVMKSSSNSRNVSSSENIDYNATFSRKSLAKLRDSQKSDSDSSVVLNGTFRRSLNRTKELNTTFDIESFDQSVVNESEMKSAQSIEEIIDAKVSQSFGANFSGTYRRTPKSHGTFRKSDIAKAAASLNSTFEVSKDDQLELSNKGDPVENISVDLNATQTIEIPVDQDNIGDTKKETKESSIVPDLNRLSYCIEETARPDSTFRREENLLNATMDIKRLSLGSADSLDRMSSISGSSKDSNKLVHIDMAEVDAIVEMQERSLNQVMSTPKPNTGTKNIFDNHFISPIANHGSSESEVSSNDDYKSVNAISPKGSVENYIKHPKSLGYLGNKVDSKLKPTHRSTYTLPVQKPLQALPNNIRGSYSNLRAPVGAHGNQSRPSGLVRPQAQSNLKSMAPKLKGSYTSLKPVNTNLPVAPPPPTNVGSNPNGTFTQPRASGANVNVVQVSSSQTKVVEVQPMPREKSAAPAGDSTFIKPQAPRASGLPRPTGIPRPASKIPGPRSSNLRPISSRSSRQNIG